MSAEQRIDLAALLVEAGAGSSARAVLGSVRGAAANRLRARADTGALRAGVYALTALQFEHEGAGSVDEGVAVPLLVEPGEPRSIDEESRLACTRARDLVRARLGLSSSDTAVRLAGDARWPVRGPSIGLGAALAFAHFWMPSRALPEAVLATGALGEDGSVRAVGHMEAKRSIASRERGARLVLAPAEGEGARDGERLVRTLDEALAVVFGPGPYEPDVRVLRFEERLARACAEPDMERASASLHGLLAQTDLAHGDRVRVALELGTRLRHLGRTDEALALHRAARVELDDPSLRALLGGESAERYELECCATEMDDFAIERVTEALRARVVRPFLLTRNELRCRGMLAQAAGMAGAFTEATRLREQNLALHARSEALRAVLPGTLCWAALDAARAGDSPRFEQHARALVSARRPGDTQQARYDGACLLRALVALGRDADALRWAHGESLLYGAPAPECVLALARGADPVSTYPEVSALRSLVRAHWRTGSYARARECASRARPAGGPLVAWMGTLVSLEYSLALRASGDEPRAREARDRARSSLRATHRSASAHAAHEDLFSDLWGLVENALDRVWY